LEFPHAEHLGWGELDLPLSNFETIMGKSITEKLSDVTTILEDVIRSFWFFGFWFISMLIMSFSHTIRYTIFRTKLFMPITFP
jgi:hypothetical protein